MTAGQERNDVETFFTPSEQPISECKRLSYVVSSWRNPTGAQCNAALSLIQFHMHHLEGARFALKNHPGHWKTLELSGTRERDLFGWLDQARKFYSNAHQAKDILKQYQLNKDDPARAKYGISRHGSLQRAAKRNQRSSSCHPATQRGPT